MSEDNEKTEKSETQSDNHVNANGSNDMDRSKRNWYIPMAHGAGFAALGQWLKDFLF